MGNDFVTNNTDTYISGIIKQGIFNPETQDVTVTQENPIILEEFSTRDINPIPTADDNEIGFSCLYCDENIIAKKLIIDTNAKLSGGNIFISRFQLTENIWEIVFGTNEFVPHLHIETEHEISDNDFSLFPGESVHITFYGVKDNPEFKLTTK